MKGILGKKVGMTQIFDERGDVIPVTVIEAGPCFVVQKRTKERDGYRGIQLGFEEVKPKRLNKGQLGHLRKNNMPPLRYLREIRISEKDEYEEGQKITVGIFTVGERVDVVGVSKGRGFAGTVKRHGFNRQPKTHGQSDRERAPGSIGSTTTPGRVYKGKRMAGHMGNARVTAQNLQVVMVDPERNLLAVKGAVPGARGGLVIIKEARKQG
ncbi:MAG: 50S ribosomal protein L3 [Anaerolineae bacterium]|jgi:large subunit ribosomal protein L3|nr:50S ribosomal protein L3 [Anaerolineae bacterium]MDH7473485.1 50S ribosomal protein L3 [Anaerolineae bacterium]